MKKVGRYKQPDGRTRYVLVEMEKGIIIKQKAIPKPEKLWKMLEENDTKKK